MKLLGFIDLLSGILLILFQHDLVGTRLMISLIIYLAIKAFIFKGDVASFIDAGIAIYIIIMMLHPFLIITYLLAIYLFQKGFVSMMG